MNPLQVFHYGEIPVRTVMQDGEPWWVLKDVCQVLNLSDTNKTAERLDPDELTRTKLVSGGQMREMYLINESGLYKVILRSDKPEAKKFTRWVTHEVLPAIRRTGQYGLAPAQPMVSQRVPTTDDYLKAASIVANCRNERLPYVLGLLEQGGMYIPQVKELVGTDGRHTRYAKTDEDVSAQLAACELIRTVIEQYGFSLAQLSRITGINGAALQRYKSTHRPTPERARYIVEIINRHLPQDADISEVDTSQN